MKMEVDMQAELLPSVCGAYCLLLSHEGVGYVKLISHFKNLISSMVKEGTAVPITSATLRTRAALGLAPITFDQEEIKKIAEVTGLQEALVGFQ